MNQYFARSKLNDNERISREYIMRDKREEERMESILYLPPTPFAVARCLQVIKYRLQYHEIDIKSHQTVKYSACQKKSTNI